MRKWIPVALIGLTILWFIATSVGSSMALADIAGRPVLAVTRSDGTRFAVQPQGKIGRASCRERVCYVV